MIESEPTRFFTLEEAAAMLPEVRMMFEQAHRELNELRDQLILHKRIQLHHPSNEEPAIALEQVFQEKRKAYEETFTRWVERFLAMGILVRDIDRGLIDFPYQTNDGEVFCLCWQLDEDGLFYFHDMEEGFAGRKPIALLPD